MKFGLERVSIECGQMVQNILTLPLITREAVQLWQNSNMFLHECDWVEPISMPKPYIIGAKEVVLLGAAAIMAKNPEVTRRFWRGWLS